MWGISSFLRGISPNKYRNIAVFYRQYDTSPKNNIVSISYRLKKNNIYRMNIVIDFDTTYRQ